MRRLLLIIFIALFSCGTSRAQFYLGGGVGYTQVGYASSDGSSSTPYFALQLTPYYQFKSKWGAGGNLGWNITGNGPYRYRNVYMFLAGYHDWDVSDFSFKLGLGPSIRIRYCKVDGNLLSLITTLKVGVGLEPSVTYHLTPRCGVFFSPLMETHFYDPLGAYYTQGLAKRFVWACNLICGVTFSL